MRLDKPASSLTWLAGCWTARTFSDDSSLLLFLSPLLFFLPSFLFNYLHDCSLLLLLQFPYSPSFLLATSATINQRHTRPGRWELAEWSGPECDSGQLRHRHNAIIVKLLSLFSQGGKCHLEDELAESRRAVPGGNYRTLPSVSPRLLRLAGCWRRASIEQFRRRVNGPTRAAAYKFLSRSNAISKELRGWIAARITPIVRPPRALSSMRSREI